MSIQGNAAFHVGGYCKSIPQDILEKIPDGYELVQESELDDKFHPDSMFWGQNVYSRHKELGFNRAMDQAKWGCWYFLAAPDIYIKPIVEEV